MKINKRQKTIYNNYIKIVSRLLTPIIVIIIFIYGIIKLKNRDNNIGIILLIISLCIIPAYLISYIIGSILGLPIILFKDITNPEEYVLYYKLLDDTPIPEEIKK